MLPETYGPWNTVYQRFNDWSKKGIWQEFLDHCINDPDRENTLLDSTIVRAHACAAGYAGSSAEEQGLGRSKGGFSSKIHVQTDALGNAMKFILTGGQVNDITQAATLISHVKDTHVIADKAYDSDAFIEAIKNKNSIPVIPSRSNRKTPRDYDKHVYKERHLIEVFMGKIKYFRRIFSRFDKTARNYLSFWCFAGALSWVK